jgi:YmgG-like glycine-zipper protein
MPTPSHRASTPLRIFGHSALILAGSMAAQLLIAGQAFSQGQAPIIYPSQGQSLERQSRDEGQCHGWAQQQTGFNPASGVQAPPPPQQGGEVVRGAVGGAAVGAVGGAIGGNTGKGAAIGAGIGATVGLLGRRQKRAEASAGQQQAIADYNAGIAQYNRAFAACMSGRGYTVN